MSRNTVLKHSVIALITFFVMGGTLFLIFQFSEDVLRNPQLYFEEIVAPLDAAIVVLAVMGVVISVLFAYVVYLLLASRTRSELTASGMTRDLALGREQFRRLYDDAPISYMMLAPDKTIQNPNKIMSHLLDTHPDSLSGKSFLAFVHSDDQKDVEQYAETALRGAAVNEKETRLVLASGSERWVLMSLFNIIIPGTRKQGSFVSMVDITEQKRLEEAKTEFVSLASHQLRTPLTALKWYSELLSGGDVGQLNEKQQQYMERVHASTQTMVELVDTLLNVSRLETGRLEADVSDTDVVKLAESVVEELAPTIEEKQLHVETTFADAFLNIKTDAKLIRIVIQNLMSNAVKYTPEGGTVRLGLLDEGGKQQIVVSDTGHGIPQAEQDRIFSKMFRASNVKKLDVKGTGLGLYLVRAITDLFGGSVSFTSEEGVGTTFTVTLP